MAIADNVNDVSFYSGYKVDKIVRIFSGTYNRATDMTTRVYSIGNVQVYRIAHGLTRPVACEMIDSEDGGTTYFDGGIRRVAFSDSTYVYIFDKVGAVGAGTVNYKVWCSWIDDYDTSNPYVTPAQYTDTKTQFDSRLNYQKIYTAPELSFTAGVFGATETQSIAHPFAYTPNAKVWFEAFPGEVWSLNSGGASNPFLVDNAQNLGEIFIDSNSVDVKMFKFSNTTIRAWVKVFYDAD